MSMPLILLPDPVDKVGNTKLPNSYLRHLSSKDPKLKVPIHIIVFINVPKSVFETAASVGLIMCELWHTQTHHSPAGWTMPQS